MLTAQVEGDPEAYVYDRQRLELVQQAFALLHSSEQMALLLYICGYNGTERAGILNVKPWKARGWLQRAIYKLQRYVHRQLDMCPVTRAERLLTLREDLRAFAYRHYVRELEAARCEQACTDRDGKPLNLIAANDYVRLVGFFPAAQQEELRAMYLVVREALFDGDLLYQEFLRDLCHDYLRGLEEREGAWAQTLRYGLLYYEQGHYAAYSRVFDDAMEEKHGCET